jgi:sec-independent protein translocase protein TatB
VFDVGLGEAAVLIVLALVIFGDRLPSVAAQAGRALRQLRAMANNAKADLRAGLGPEFADFDPADLHPRRFVQKHLLSDIDDDYSSRIDPTTPEYTPPKQEFSPSPDPLEGKRPPFDCEAT